MDTPSWVLSNPTFWAGWMNWVEPQRSPSSIALSSTPITGVVRLDKAGNWYGIGGLADGRGTLQVNNDGAVSAFASPADAQAATNTQAASHGGWA